MASGCRELLQCPELGGTRVLPHLPGIRRHRRHHPLMRGAGSSSSSLTRRALRQRTPLPISVLEVLPSVEA